jgi:hypothetical protein
MVYAVLALGWAIAGGSVGMLGVELLRRVMRR